MIQIAMTQEELAHLKQIVLGQSGQELRKLFEDATPEKQLEVQAYVAGWQDAIKVVMGLIQTSETLADVARKLPRPQLN